MATFAQQYFGNPLARLKSISFIILAILMFIFIITQIVRVAKANQMPLFAYVYEEGLNPSEVFPQVAICPTTNGSSLGEITSVTCTFYKVSDNSQTSLSVIPQQSFQIDYTSYSCWTIQGPMPTAHNLSDLIKCEVWTDMNIIVSFFDSSISAPSNWFGWQVLAWGQDSAIGIVKWYFQGQEVGYQIDSIQQEYRFEPSGKNSYGVLFTLQWDFLGQGNYGEFTTYDFWTGLGVVGGYCFLASQFYLFLVWAGKYLFRIDEEEIPRPKEALADSKDKDKDYGAL